MKTKITPSRGKINLCLDAGQLVALLIATAPYPNPRMAGNRLRHRD